MALDFEDLKVRVAQRAPNPCAACGGIDFDLQPDLVLLPGAQPDGAESRPPNGGYPCALLVCTRCGFVRLHALTKLGGAD
jgi:hypothetical protein